MTAGTVVSGVRAGGYYRYRDWSGTDGPRSEEHPYSYRVTESFFPPLKYKPFTWVNGTMMDFCPGLPFVGTDLTANLLNKCTMKVWGDLAQSQFNAGVFAGEFKESYLTICSIVRAIARSIQAFKRGAYRLAWRTLMQYQRGNTFDWSGQLANQYMLYHFGIKPLLHDIADMYELMLHSYKVVKRVRRSAGFKDSAVKSLSGMNWQWRIKAVAEIRGQVEMIELSPMDRLSVSDIFDSAGVAWEITRLSWMLDWILPVGNFLAAVSASNKTKGAVFFVTRHQEESLRDPVYTGKMPVVPVTRESFSYYSNPGASNSRTALSKLPWAFPTIQNPLGDNLSRWVTSAAFLRQSIGR